MYDFNSLVNCKDTIEHFVNSENLINAMEETGETGLVYPNTVDEADILFDRLKKLLTDYQQRLTPEDEERNPVIGANIVILMNVWRDLEIKFDVTRDNMFSVQ